VLASRTGGLISCRRRACRSGFGTGWPLAVERPIRWADRNLGSGVTVEETMNRPSLLALVLGASFVPTAAHAYSAVISFDDLVKKSEMVVVARVLNIHDSQAHNEHVRIATATIVEWWKGDGRANHVEYVASPSWFLCDVSSAKLGETVVLFLERDKNDNLLHIANFGRGRMPVDREGSASFAAVYQVTFPAGISVQRQARYPRADIVLLSSLRSGVRAR
jgi:hypothetical protein